MNRKHLIVSLLALVASAGAMAQSASTYGRAEGQAAYLNEYGIDTRPVMTDSRFMAMGNWSSIGLAESREGLLAKYGFDNTMVMSAVPRSVVLAELEIYREAGLDQLERGERGADFSSPQYLRAKAKYEELRNSPRFMQIVQRIAHSRGEQLRVAG